MLKRLDSDAPSVRFTFEDTTLEARAGDSLAAALLGAGVRALRETPVSGAARAPFCMMGACFDCLVEIDGVSNRQACMETVREGMQVRRQHGAKELGAGELATGELSE